MPRADHARSSPHQGARVVSSLPHHACLSRTRLTAIWHSGRRASPRRTSQRGPDASVHAPKFPATRRARTQRSDVSERVRLDIAHTTSFGSCPGAGRNGPSGANQSLEVVNTTSKMVRMTAEEDPVLTAEWLLTNFLSTFHHLGKLHPVRIRSDEAAQTHGRVRRTPADGGHERATRSSSHDYRVTWPQSRPATISARTAQNGCCMKPAWCRPASRGVGASGSRKIFTFRQAQGPDPTDTDGDRTEPTVQP